MASRRRCPPPRSSPFEHLNPLNERSSASAISPEASSLPRMEQNGARRPSDARFQSILGRRSLVNSRPHRSRPPPGAAARCQAAASPVPHRSLLLRGPRLIRLHRQAAGAAVAQLREPIEAQVGVRGGLRVVEIGQREHRLVTRGLRGQGLQDTSGRLHEALNRLYQYH